ncbi:MAG: DUF1778 domain-containing protein [Cyanomargarita calcarea GSE-NOS-MK-12-04C]|jgi:uncharacterized protein (DUF1778 family)|uniref:DUF1778 domain-containing protein n=1 Tax=Cyanomargarita calcarea GSE-NOS-MK-12-04C TaxID=2839659 RepID=A0A951QQN7_9CYAN|nr:DUF1778 domain-containing protein [Cyanomargarita calcarea GSE-NOS-MK-12-04C]
MQPHTEASNHQNRDVTINIRAHQRQRDLIDRAAEALGKNRSDFMLESVCREAEAVLLDRRLFMLDDDKFQQFIELLDAPPSTNANLHTLLTTKAPWEQ